MGKHLIALGIVVRQQGDGIILVDYPEQRQALVFPCTCNIGEFGLAKCIDTTELYAVDLKINPQDSGNRTTEGVSGEIGGVSLLESTPVVSLSRVQLSSLLVPRTEIACNFRLSL